MSLTVNQTPLISLPPPARSILDERPARPPVSGKIRTGIKVLTKTAAQNTAALKIFQDGLLADRSFDAIEKDIETKCSLKNALTPRNVPYFRVSRGDFTMPEIAGRILELYGEDRDNGHGRQLYRLPVILPFDDTLAAMPNQLESYTASGRKYWSEYDQAGQRFCMKYRASEVDPRNQRAFKTWGGRKPEINTEFNACGHCDPEACPIYQKSECKLTASLLFWIPGIPGSSLIELGTGSIYSMKQMRASMDLVAAARNGRLSGLHNGRPVFYLAKVEAEVTQLKDGQPKKVRQFLTHLEADVNMMEVLAARDALPTPVKAIGHVLTPPVVVDVIPQQAALEASNPVAPKPKNPPEVAAARRHLNERLLALQIPQQMFADRCFREWGEHWSVQLDSLQAAIDTLPADDTSRADFDAWMNKAPF